MAAISIKTSTWEGDGIQIQYNSGTPRFYVGDSGNEYFKYVKGSGIELSTAKANAITIRSGGSIKLYDGGDIVFTTVDAPGACTASLIETSGNVDEGTHKYRITFVNADGETELGDESNTVTTDSTHKQVSLTSIPTSSSYSVTARKIYRTKAGGSDYYYLATINDNTTTTYTDNIADASLGNKRYLSTPNTTYGRIYLDSDKLIDINRSNILLGYEVGQSLTTGFSNFIAV